MGNVFDEGCQSLLDIWNSSQYQALRRTVNTDSLEKYYAYCAECPCRFGMGDSTAHIEDDTWLERLELDATQKAMILDLRRRGKNPH